VAALCAGEDPAGCHRRLLVGRVLGERGIAVAHIRGDGRLQTEAELAAAEPHGNQLSLFAEIEASWKSVPSVSPKKTAEQFFTLLKRAGIRRLLDVRLNNVSQLAGFAKREDLRFFLNEICGAEYRHELLLAPTQAMLDDYKKSRGPWPAI